jgi:hypothetical protein
MFIADARMSTSCHIIAVDSFALALVESSPAATLNRRRGTPSK